MSETVTDPTIETPDPIPEALDTPIVETAPDTAQDPEPTPEPTPEPAPKPKQGDRRFAQVTARLAAESDARKAAERRAEAAEALLANKTDDEPKPPAAPANREAEIEQAAARRVAERELTSRLARIDTDGKKSLGAEAWEAAKSTMTALGATANQTFLQALAEADVPDKIFAALSEDADGLVELLNKSPTAMAAAIGRMDAKLSAPPPPVVRPLSAAPRPAVPIQPAAVLAEIDPFGADQDKLSMADWNAAFEKTALGKKLLRPRAGR